MLKIFLLCFISIFAFSLNFDNLYEKAQEAQNKHNYKEAMLLYKQIASKKLELRYINKEQEDIIQASKLILNEVQDEQTVKTIEQVLSSSFNIYPYKENYFLPFSHTSTKIKDRNINEAKFQLSIKKPIIKNFFNLNESFYFAYTQTSWWQIYSPSAPFRETNYAPEIFVNIPYGKKDKTSLKAFKIGLLHESNGRKDENSRSWNRIYLESYFQVSNLFIVPKIWYRLREDKKDDDNKDIENYLGYGDITFLLPFKKHVFKLLFRNNLRFNDKNKSYAQIDYTFPLFSSKDTFAYVQISNGYGDSLIDYDKSISRFSFGISLSR